MASPTRWMWVWVNSGSWWWTRRPGVQQFMGSQRVTHDWATELTDLWIILVLLYCLEFPVQCWDKNYDIKKKKTLTFSCKIKNNFYFSITKCDIWYTILKKHLINLRIIPFISILVSNFITINHWYIQFFILTTLNLISIFCFNLLKWWFHSLIFIC